jgi:hypothetical protein
MPLHRLSGTICGCGLTGKIDRNGSANPSKVSFVAYQVMLTTTFTLTYQSRLMEVVFHRSTLSNEVGITDPGFSLVFQVVSELMVTQLELLQLDCNN